jgi:Lsr2
MAWWLTGQLWRKNADMRSRFDIVVSTVHYLSMAKTVSVVVTDDLDGTPEAETVAFTFNGQSYEIDLGEKNRAELEKFLQPFMDAGRRTAQRRTAKAARPAGPRIDRAVVRAWAISQGLKDGYSADSATPRGCSSGGFVGGDPLPVDRSGDDEVDAPRDPGGLVGVIEVGHPDERGLAIPAR